MSTAPNYTPRYTVADYEQWQGDWELWQGTAVAMTPSPFGKHQFVLVNLVSELRAALKGTDWRVLAEIDWRISDTTVVRPDALILIGEVPDRHVQQTPVLVAEITSESTEDKDRTAKFQLYQQQGVQTYLLIDPKLKTADCFVLDDSQQFARHSDAISFAGPAGTSIRIDMATLFD